MNWLHMFELQKVLDDRILEQHQLDREQLFEHKLLALSVEIGELANETRCFKYWSMKPPSDKETILEEYVDGLHFILSLGIDAGFHERASVNAKHGKMDYSLTDQFLFIYKMIQSFKLERSEQHYVQLLEHYVSLGHMLGFTEYDIEHAYLSKNEVNHERQNQGY